MLCSSPLALLVSDFGPNITIKIVESLRDDIYARKLKSRTEIKDALKKSVLDILTKKGSNSKLKLGFRKPAVIMIVAVGVNGGGKTTSLGGSSFVFCGKLFTPNRILAVKSESFLCGRMRHLPVLFQQAWFNRGQQRIKGLDLRKIIISLIAMQAAIPAAVTWSITTKFFINLLSWFTGFITGHNMERS